MNKQITQLFGLIVLLFAILVVFTSRWTVFEAESLEENSANRRPLLEEQRTPRGLIFAADGERLVRNKRLGSGEQRRYVREYPFGPLVAQPIGYSFIERGRAGIEQSRDDELAGREDEFETILEELEGADREGYDVRTSLDLGGQRVAQQALGGRRGSIVALDPDTGRVAVMYSEPSFDPNRVPTDFRSLQLFNRATQARYPPGSTMKVVTAAAALDTGRYEPGSIVSGKSPKKISGVDLANFGGQDFGPVSLTDALTNSVNTVWAEVAVKLGKETYFEYMERFGFNEEPPLDYPRDQITPSGVFNRGRLITDADDVDIGRVAIGQERLQVTPLQMAMVAAAVANGGELMEPRLTERIVARDGRVKDRIEPEEQSRVMSEKAAADLTAMMARVVEEGSGTQAALEGIKVAGKTGTAEVEGGAANQAWFIGFAPLDDPEMAIAVTVERTQGQGGTVAAPLAKRVLQELIGNG